MIGLNTLSVRITGSGHESVRVFSFDPVCWFPNSRLFAGFSDRQGSVDWQIVRNDLLLAGWPDDFNGVHFVGIRQPEIQRHRTLPEIAGFAVVIVGEHAVLRFDENRRTQTVTI